MNSQLRRTHILEYLAQADGPPSATAPVSVARAPAPGSGG